MSTSEGLTPDEAMAYLRDRLRDRWPQWSLRWARPDEVPTGEWAGLPGRLVPDGARLLRVVGTDPPYGEWVTWVPVAGVLDVEGLDGVVRAVEASHRALLEQAAAKGTT